MTMDLTALAGLLSLRRTRHGLLLIWRVWLKARRNRDPCRPRRSSDRLRPRHVLDAIAEHVRKLPRSGTACRLLAATGIAPDLFSDYDRVACDGSSSANQRRHSDLRWPEAASYSVVARRITGFESRCCPASQTDAQNTYLGWKMSSYSAVAPYRGVLECVRQ